MPTQKDTSDNLGTEESRRKVFEITKRLRWLPEENMVIISNGGLLLLDKKSLVANLGMGKQLLPEIFCG